MTAPPPGPESQLEFLAKLQRLFAEGDFTATYKFALLISLADLAVEVGRDDGEPLTLTVHQIDEKFIDLYWQQSAPYRPTRDHQALLVQNHGRQAAIVTAIAAFRRRSGATTLPAAGAPAQYPALVREVAGTVADQPLTYLQNFGGTTDSFLYVREPGRVLLWPGIAYCLRRFQPLVQQLARSHWINHLKRNRLNQPILGMTDDLETFLFETPRQTLALIGEGLRRLDRHCFYCGADVHKADVDHFVPFSLYPHDLIHNFVLSHPQCNRSKSDTLAARPHLERWLGFIDRHHSRLLEIGAAAGQGGDLDSSRAIARWGYANALASGGHAWVRPKTYEPVDHGYLERFA